MFLALLCVPRQTKLNIPFPIREILENLTLVKVMQIIMHKVLQYSSLYL